MRYLTAILLVATLLLAVFGCARERGEPVMFTGAQVSNAQIVSEIPFATTGSLQYAVANSAWIEWYYGQFRARLSEGQYGVTKWDGSFKCTAFTTSFVGDAQMKFFAQSFHSSIAARTIAIGEYWYRPDSSGPNGEGHAVVIAFTEDPAKRFFEPQTGKWVTLSATEQSIQRMVTRKFN